MNNMQRLVGVSLCFFILCLWICPVDCFAQGGFRVGAYVKFIDYEGKTRYGTIEAITGDPFKILTFEGDSVEMRVGNLRRIENMGMTKKVTPNWSYVEQDLEVYEFIDTSGISKQAGYYQVPGFRIRDTEGKLSAAHASSYALLEIIDSLPSGDQPEDKPEEETATAPPPEPDPKKLVPKDLAKYDYHALEGKDMKVYMDRWGEGYVYDSKREEWIPIPDMLWIQPAFTKASDTMVLFYGINDAAVYDSEKGEFFHVGIHQGRRFSTFTRSEMRRFAAQCNDRLALAVGLQWSAVYDLSLHKWIYLSGGADDDFRERNQNMVIASDTAIIKVLNDTFYAYEEGSQRFVPLAEFRSRLGKPNDINEYNYRILVNRAVRVYMDEWGLGYVHDSNRDKWIKIPDIGRIQPSYAKTSDTLALIYAANSVAVYDTDKGDFVTATTHQGRQFSSFTRSDTRNFAAQCNDDLALAAGLIWNAVYDRTTGTWNYLSGGTDDTTADLPNNLALFPDQASIKVLGGARYNYKRGSRSFIKGELSTPQTPPGEYRSDKIAEIELSYYLKEAAPGGMIILPRVWGVHVVTGESIYIPPWDVVFEKIHGPLSWIGLLPIPGGSWIAIVSEDARVGLDEILFHVRLRGRSDLRDALTILIREKKIE